MHKHSDMLIEAYYRLLVDIRDLSGVPIGLPDDITYDWVLTEAPKLDKALLAWLEGYGVYPEIPEWLTPLTDAFRLKQDGALLQFIRQALLFCYKAEYEPTQQQLEASQEAFCQADQGCAVWASSQMARLTPLILEARRIIASVIYKCDWFNSIPSHGPGAVFPPLEHSDRSRFKTFYPTIAEKFPYDQWFWPTQSLIERIPEPGFQDSLVCSDDIIAKMVAVPKDSRGPRLICVHPAEAVWIQQSLRRVLERAILRSPITSGKINFHDQSVNAGLALASSSSREFVTLDLKEASDRMSSSLVRLLFGDYVYEILSCCRANKIRYLNGRVVDLEKWAPMGNALVFPVQSLVFFSLVQAGIRCHYGINCRDIYVFGDDIIYPSKYHDGALAGLVRAGFVPNPHKTFKNGLFRESCGVDAYNGKDVTPLRLKVRQCHSAQEAVSLCSLALRLRQRGYGESSSYLYTVVRNRFGYLPLCNNPDGQGLFEYIDCDFGHLMLNEPRLKFKRDIQQWVVPSRQIKGRNRALLNHDWCHVLDSLLRLERMPDRDSDRGLLYPIPYSERLTYGWTLCL